MTWNIVNTLKDHTILRVNTIIKNKVGLIFFASALSGCVSTQPVSINNASVFWDMATLAYSSASTISPEEFYRLNQADQISIILGKIATNYMPEYVCKDEEYTISIYNGKNAATKITTVTPINDEKRVLHPIYVNGFNLHTGEPFSKKFPSYNASEDQKISVSPNKDISAFSIFNSPPLNLVETLIKQLKEEVKCEASQIHQHIQAVVPIGFLNLSENKRNRVAIEDLSASKNVEQTLIKLFKARKIPSRFYNEIVKTLEDLKRQEKKCKNQGCQTKKHRAFLQTATKNVKKSKESLQWYLKNTLGIQVKIQAHNLLNVMKRLGAI